MIIIFALSSEFSFKEITKEGGKKLLYLPRCIFPTLALGSVESDNQKPIWVLDVFIASVCVHVHVPVCTFIHTPTYLHLYSVC